MSNFTALSVSEEEEADKMNGTSTMAVAAPTADRSAGGTGGGFSLSNVSSLLSVETIQNAVMSMFREARPWGEFMNPKSMSLPTFSELRDRVVENFKYYRYNYLVIFMGLSSFAVLTNPLSLLGLAIIALAYFYLFMYSQTPFKMFGFELDTTQKKSIALILFACVILWLTGAGATLSTLLTTVVGFAVIHATLNKSPNEADFETAFSPSNV